MNNMTNIKRMRILKGMKQKDLASLAGVHPPAVAVLEQRGCYDTRTAVRYAKAMKCNPIFLLEGLDFIQQDNFDLDTLPQEKAYPTSQH